MNSNFLKRLFMACSEEGPHYAEGMNLSELYERNEDTNKAEQEFSEVLSTAKLSFTMADAISDAAGDIASAYEMQGFINGFRMCFKLYADSGLKVARVV